jgi:hypothetical protein
MFVIIYVRASIILTVIVLSGRVMKFLKKSGSSYGQHLLLYGLEPRVR